MTDIYKQYGGTLPFPIGWGNLLTYATLLCDHQGEAVAAVFCMPVDDTITQIGFRCASKANTPPDDTWTAGIQGLTTGGLPDDTYLNAGNAKVTLPGASGNVSTYSTGTYHFLTLGATAALQAGGIYALVVQKTGADDTTNTLTFSNGMTAVDKVSSLPYIVTAAAGGAWTKGLNNPVGWALRSATRTYFFPLLTSTIGQSVGTTTEKGFTFTLPAAFGTSNSYGVRGISLSNGISLAAGGTYTLNLYSDPLGTPSIIQTTGQLDSDHATAGAGRTMELLFPEDTLATLVPGTKYGIGFSCSQAASWGVYTITLPDAGSRDAYPWGGLTYMSRTLASAYPPDSSDGAFAETTTTIVQCELILSQFTAAAAATGGNANILRGSTVA